MTSQKRIQEPRSKSFPCSVWAGKRAMHRGTAQLPGQWPSYGVGLARLTDSREGGRSAGGLGKGVKVHAGERTTSPRVETKPSHSGSALVPGAALVHRAPILERTQAAGRAPAAAFSQRNLEGRTGSPPSGGGSPRPASLPLAPPCPAAPGSARRGQGGARARGGRAGAGLCGRR